MYGQGRRRNVLLILSYRDAKSPVVLSLNLVYFPVSGYSQMRLHAMSHCKEEAGHGCYVWALVFLSCDFMDCNSPVVTSTLLSFLQSASSLSSSICGDFPVRLLMPNRRAFSCIYDLTLNGTGTAIYSRIQDSTEAIVKVRERYRDVHIRRIGARGAVNVDSMKLMEIAKLQAPLYVTGVG